MKSAKIFIAIILITNSIGSAFASEINSNFKPFVMLDVSKEKDADTSKSKLANEYINANLTLGVKTPEKMEYSIKFSQSQKDNNYISSTSRLSTLSSGLEVKVKKSIEVTSGLYPYVSVRLGQKINSQKTYSDVKSFTYYALDLGTKISFADSWAVDLGVRLRDADDQDYQSVRYHSTLLYDLNKSNTLGLRYSTSSSDNNTTEKRKGLRLHWQHNY
jgi:opacity protein-like surface antigen